MQDLARFASVPCSSLRPQTTTLDGSEASSCRDVREMLVPPYATPLVNMQKRRRRGVGRLGLDLKSNKIFLRMVME
jgi:hypothetical protein